jgi:predicted dehydrogenase
MDLFVEKIFRWGIIGPGKIAHKFSQSLPFSKNGKLVSVASTSLYRSIGFSQLYGAEYAFGSYEEMLKSGTIDAVYIATPHSFHFDNAALAISAGIPVLCEKPMTLSHPQTNLLADFARDKQVFLMEGMWSMFLPHILKALEWIDSNKIGEVVHVQADFGYRAEYNPEGRLFNPDLGGSVSKDIGIYPLALFYKILGALEGFQVQGNRAKTGVDQHVVFQGKGRGNATFQGQVSFLTHTEVEAIIFGTEGKIKIESQWFRPTSATLFHKNGTEIFGPKVDSFGFQFESDEVEKCVSNGLTESTRWTHSDSISMAEYISILEAV